MVLTEFTCPPQSIDFTPAMLGELERSLNKIWQHLGVEVELGSANSHFFERLNDERNHPHLSFCEVQEIFVKEFQKFGHKIAALHPNFEGVMTDLETKVNIPFMIKLDPYTHELELVAKTVMRKGNFLSSSPKFQVEELLTFREWLKEIKMENCFVW